MVTVADIQRVVTAAEPAIGSMPVRMGCDHINGALEQALRQDLGTDDNQFHVEMVYTLIPNEVATEADPTCEAKTGHMFLRIPTTSVTDSAHDIFVDGALSQFSRTHYEASPDINTILSRTPDGIVVTTAPSETFYSYYVDWTPIPESWRGS
jgi:hypothetical protein